ncbi:hypothetical protein EI555_017705, partial [Monodon monoceros]
PDVLLLLPQQEAQVPKASGQDEQGCFSTFLPEGTRGGQEVSLESRPEGWGEPLLPASQCQPLFRTCQALSDLSSNTLLVSVMFMDSQMRVYIRKFRGVRARAWPRNRRATAWAWRGLDRGLCRAARGLPDHPQHDYSPPESVLTNRRALLPTDGSYQAPRDAWGRVPLLPPPSQAALARFTESSPDPVKCACTPPFGPGVLEITWQPLELGSLAPNLASDLAPDSCRAAAASPSTRSLSVEGRSRPGEKQRLGQRWAFSALLAPDAPHKAPEQVSYGTEHNLTPNQSERPGLASQASGLLSPRQRWCWLGGGCVSNGIPGSGMCNSQSAPHKCTQGAYIKQAEPRSHTSWTGNPEQLCPARPRVQRPSWEQAYSMMTSPYSLPYLLFLPLGACFPVLDTEEPADAVGSIGGEICWADLAGGRHFPWGSPGWPRAPHPHALLAMAKEPPMLGRACAGFTLRLGREQDDGSEVTGFLLGDGEKAGGLLGTLAEELNGYTPARARRPTCSTAEVQPPRSPGKRLHGAVFFNVLWGTGSVSSDKAVG